jgi:hypothetical protein
MAGRNDRLAKHAMIRPRSPLLHDAERGHYSGGDSAIKLTRFIVLLLAVAAPTSAVRPAERVWGPAVRRIEEAVRIPDERARENALRAAVRNGLITFNREISTIHVPF